MMPTRRVYLAGPDVFARDPVERGRRLKEVLAEYGLVGVFPLDVELSAEGGEPGELAARIHAENEKLIESCDAVLANITPFRGPSADPGTVYEIGYARGLGKIVVGYSTARDLFTHRTLDWVERLGHQVSERADGSQEDGDQMRIEAFGLNDNLMIDAAILASGGVIVAGQAAPEQLAAEELSARIHAMAQTLAGDGSS